MEQKDQAVAFALYKVGRPHGLRPCRLRAAVNRGDVGILRFLLPGLDGAVSDVHLGETLDHFFRAVFEN